MVFKSYGDSKIYVIPEQIVHSFTNLSKHGTSCFFLVLTIVTIHAQKGENNKHVSLNKLLPYLNITTLQHNRRQ